MSSPGSGRRTPSRGSRPAGRGGPGRARPARPRAAAGTPSRETRPGRPAAARPSRAPRPAGPRPRLTSRAAVLVVIVAVLAVSYASSARAYLQQREQLRESQAKIDASEANIARMEREVARQGTDAYVEQELRELGWVDPGDTPYLVTDGGKPLDVESTLTDPATIDPAEPPAWWEGAWDTVRVAGNPPKRADPLPQTTIKDPEGAPPAGGSEGSKR